MSDNEMVPVRADMVDDALFLETAATRRASIQLHEVLELARQDPQPWMPYFVLQGEEGVGKTALAKRVVKQAARNVACRTGGWTTTATETVARFGHCPSHCSPIAHVPITIDSMYVTPTTDQWFHLAITPGDRQNDVLRRTSMVILDEADNLLNLSVAKQKIYLERMLAYPNRHYVYVFVGSPKLVDAMRVHGLTRVIELSAMEDDAEFARVAGMVFGTSEPAFVTEMHRASLGRIGPLMHMAALRGLSPPYHMAEAEILRLPAPGQG